MGLPAWPQPRSLTTREHDHLAASRTRSGAWRLDSRKRAAPAGGAKRETARIAADRSPERPLADPEPLHRVEAPTAVGAGDHLISATHRIIGGGSSIQDCASSLVTGLRSAERLRTRVDLDPTSPPAPSQTATASRAPPGHIAGRWRCKAAASIHRPHAASLAV
jgi:hypothetical protein